MEKQFFIDRTNEVLNAGSCCAELKQAAQAWLDAIGTADEAKAAENYIAELEEDVTPIDKLIDLLKSPLGVQIFGEAGCAGMLKKAEDSEMCGVQYCICGACTSGGAILDNKDQFLALTK